jgi:hypothetical protein
VARLKIILLCPSPGAEKIDCDADNKKQRESCSKFFDFNMKKGRGDGEQDKKGQEKQNYGAEMGRKDNSPRSENPSIS